MKRYLSLVLLLSVPFQWASAQLSKRQADMVLHTYIGQEIHDYYWLYINNVANAFDKVAQRITKEDNLFVYITDHGNKSVIPAGSYN